MQTVPFTVTIDLYGWTAGKVSMFRLPALNKSNVPAAEYLLSVLVFDEIALRLMRV